MRKNVVSLVFSQPNNITKVSRRPQPTLRSQKYSLINRKLPKVSSPISSIKKSNQQKMKPKQSISYKQTSTVSTSFQDFSFDDFFDKMVENLQSMPISESIEKFFQEMFNTKYVIFWEISTNELFSATHKKKFPKDESILWSTVQRDKFYHVKCLDNEESFISDVDSFFIPSNYSVIYFPISWNEEGNHFILQIGKPSYEEFTEQEFRNLEKFNSKLEIYGNLLFEHKTLLNISSELVNPHQSSNFLCNKLIEYFKTRTVEIYYYKPKTNQFFQITKDSSTNAGDIIPSEKIGFVSYSFNTNKIINEEHISNVPTYNSEIDGIEDESVLCIPYKDDSEQIWCFVMRRKERFTYISEIVFSVFIPFIVRTLTFIVSPPQLEAQLDNFEKRLKALLEVAEILSGVLDIDVLLPTIMDRACQLLNAERCSLFLVDSSHNELVTRFHGGLDNAIRVKIGRGIVGICAQSGETVNIRDAYADQRFDRSVDIATGFTTRTLLCIPIYNNRGEITGVTEMINKKNDGHFDEDDEKMLIAFNVFCGISLDNARLYQASLDLTRQLRTFIQMSVAINSTISLEDTLDGIMTNIQNIVNASRVTVFLNNENENSLYEYHNIGLPSSYGTVFAEESVQNRKFMLFDHHEVLGRAQTQQLNKAIEKILAAGLDADIMVFGDEEYYLEEEEEEEEEYFNNDNEEFYRMYPQSPTLSNRHSKTLTNSSSHTSTNVFDSQKTNKISLDENTEVICCIPLFSSESTILGVIEFSCNWKVMGEDIKLLDCFSVFAGISIERYQLKERAKFGEIEVELKNWISERERTLTNKIPSKLMISMDKLSQVLLVQFDAPEWDGIGHIKVLFSIFDIFDLMNRFNITNEKLFRFIFEIRNTYRKVPYHNWRHAVDVTQFTTFQILTGGLDSVFTKFELLGLIVSAICHDADHDGFNNAFNIKAETPLGILFKNQSVLETHHCSVAINVISKDECNLFHSLSPVENKNMWSLIISLILATDMAKHFDILKEFDNIMSEGKFTMEDSHCRNLLLQLILKCSDVSNVARPFQLADKWCEALCEEFFRQGDLEKARGMEYTSNLNDKAHLDKPKSQIGFYTFVCLPLFQAVAKAVPKLECNVKQLNSNLEKWKEAKKQENQKE